MTEYHLRLPVGGLRPAEPPLLQALGADPQPAAIPEQEFHAIPLRVGEEEHVPAQRIAQQPVARQTVEAFEALAHVRGPHRQIDPRRRPPAEHAQSRSSTLSNCAKVWASNPRPISIRRPLGNATARPLLAPSFSIGRPAHS